MNDHLSRREPLILDESLNLSQLRQRSFRFMQRETRSASLAPSSGRFDSDYEPEDFRIPVAFWVIVLAVFGLFFWVYLIALAVFSLDTGDTFGAFQFVMHQGIGLSGGICSEGGGSECLRQGFFRV